MPNTLNNLAFALRKKRTEAGQAPLSFKLLAVGSFFALRIEDPEGVVTVRDAARLAADAGDMLASSGLTESHRPLSGFAYIDNGVTVNWLAK